MSVMVCYFNLEVDGSMRGWLVVGDTVVLRWAGTKVLVRIAVLVTWDEIMFNLFAKQSFLTLTGLLRTWCNLFLMMSDFLPKLTVFSSCLPLSLPACPMARPNPREGSLSRTDPCSSRNFWNLCFNLSLKERFADFLTSSRLSLALFALPLSPESNLSGFCSVSKLVSRAMVGKEVSCAEPGNPGPGVVAGPSTSDPDLTSWTYSPARCVPSTSVLKIVVAPSLTRVLCVAATSPSLPFSGP